jgi:hypothetical protein
MKVSKASVRYLGFQALLNGSRRLDFSFAHPDRSVQTVSVEAACDLFSGPDHMAIQECVGICYETLKSRIAGCLDVFPESITLTPDDIARHRKPAKGAGNRRKP